MKPNDFEKKMETLKKPDTSAVKPPLELKLTILNARRSAIIGIWFIVIPVTFLFCVLLTYYFKLHIDAATWFIEFIAKLDKSPATKWIGPTVLLGLPMAGIILNALAITHFELDGNQKSLIISIKLRWMNLILLGFCLIIMLIFLAYLIVENVNHP